MPRVFAEGTAAKSHETFSADIGDYTPSLEPVSSMAIDAHDLKRTPKNAPWEYLLERQRQPGPIHVEARGAGYLRKPSWTPSKDLYRETGSTSQSSTSRSTNRIQKSSYVRQKAVKTIDKENFPEDLVTVRYSTRSQGKGGVYNLGGSFFVTPNVENLDTAWKLVYTSILRVSARFVGGTQYGNLSSVHHIQYPGRQHKLSNAGRWTRPFGPTYLSCYFRRTGAPAANAFTETEKTHCLPRQRSSAVNSDSFRHRSSEVISHATRVAGSIVVVSNSSLPRQRSSAVISDSFRHRSSEVISHATRVAGSIVVVVNSSLPRQRSSAVNSDSLRHRSSESTRVRLVSA
ncbi:hypothetical protein R3P38DRAFT_2813740 [Favolaschia claudopus]|uniref:Uncharacterized protein n=1 Tax=Favolaschia claudopus TaxID=2862362 RepID=A0AAV9Z533_9AGAR